MSTEPEAVPMKYRTVLLMHAESAEEGVVGVDHIYLPEGSFNCDDCGKPGHDPGMVALFVDDETQERPSSVLLTAAEALVVANRLQRAASLVLESEEDVPDIAREAARFSADSEPGLP